MKFLSSIFGGGAFSSSAESGGGVAGGSGSATAAIVAASATAEPGLGSTAVAGIHVEHPAQAVTAARPATLEELKRQLYQVAQGLRALHGDRSAVIIAIGVPNGAHDRFASYTTGPCLMERGLLHWAKQSLEQQMDAHVVETPGESTTKEGKP